MEFKVVLKEKFLLNNFYLFVYLTIDYVQVTSK